MEVPTRDTNPPARMSQTQSPELLPRSHILGDRILHASQQVLTTLRRRWTRIVKPGGSTPAEPRGPSISPSSDDAAGRLEDDRYAPAVSDMKPAPLAAEPAQPAQPAPPRKRTRTFSLSLWRKRPPEQTSSAILPVPFHRLGPPLPPSSGDATDRLEGDRDVLVVTNMEPAPLLAELAQPVPPPILVPRKRTRTHSLSLRRKQPLEQTGSAIPPVPVHRPDAFGPHPLVHVTPVSFAASRAQPPVQYESLSAAGAGRHTACTLPPLIPRQQAQTPSRNPTPHVPPSPTPVMSGPRAASSHHILVRPSASSSRSLGAAARILRIQQGEPGEEHRIVPPPSGMNTSISRANIATTGATTEDRNAACRATLQKTDVQVDKRQGSDEDQPSDAEDMVPFWDNSAAFSTPGRLQATPGSGMRSNTPGNGFRPNAPGGGTQALNEGVPSVPGCRRSEKQKICHVPAVLDDREESQLASAPPQRLSTHLPDTTQIHTSRPPRDTEEDEGDDAAGASEVSRQRSPEGREEASQKPAASVSIRPQTYWPLPVKEDDESPTVTAPALPILPSLVSTTPQSRPSHAPDQLEVSIPAFVSEQVATTISQCDNDGGIPRRVPVEVNQQGHEDERIVYPEDTSAKARGTLPKSSKKTGPRADPSIGSDEQLGDTKRMKPDDNGETGDTSHEVKPPLKVPSSQGVSTGSRSSRLCTEDVSPPQVKPSTLPPSMPSPAACSSPARQDSHESNALFSSLHGLSTGVSSPSGRSSCRHLEIERQSHPQVTTYRARITDDNAFLLPGHGGDSRLGWQPEKMTKAAPPRPSAIPTRGRRLRLNGIVTGRSEDGAEGRTISVASGKTGGSHSQRLRRTTAQTSHVGPPDVPLTSNTRSSAPPVSPRFLADLNLADGKLYTSSEIQKLKAKRERKLSESPSERLKQHFTAMRNACPLAKGYASDIGADIDLDSLEAHPFAKGAFGEVHRAKMHDGRWVAIKRLRFYTSAQDANTQKLQKKLLKEIAVWSCLEHKNVLPLLGLCVVNNELGMVSEYMPNGNIKEYIRRNPDVDRYRLAINVCAGLAYLHEHSNHIVHGDLKAMNVVVDANGVPKLMDFGLAQIDSTEISSSSSVGGTSRWMAHELMWPIPPNKSCCKPNSASDVYALGMTIYEIFSGLCPFAGKKDPQAIAAIMREELPERVPDVFSEGLWELLLRCWLKDPCERPIAREVLDILRNLSRIQGDFIDS